MSKFTDGLKKGAGCALGCAAVMGTIGFFAAGPVGFVAGVTKGLVGGAAELKTDIYGSNYNDSIGRSRSLDAHQFRQWR